MKYQRFIFISLFAALQALAQTDLPAPTHCEYTCQRDPEIVGGGMLVTVGVGATASQHPFEAHVTITNDRYPTQQTISIYQTLDRAENFNQSKTIYSGDSFKLTISETAFHHRTLGRVFSAEITLDQKSTPIKMYCSPGSGIGNPATSGSNRS